MTQTPYNPPCGGLPAQTTLMTGRAVFTEAYAVIPHGVMSDIVTSFLPGWTGTRAWILARPLSGFAETFAQYLMEVAPGGGSESPEPDAQAEGVLFVVDGGPILELAGRTHALRPEASPTCRRARPGACATTAPRRPGSTGSASATRPRRASARRTPS